MLKFLIISVLFSEMLGDQMHRDMNGQVFLFPEESDYSYVKLLPEKNGSVCLRYYSLVTRDFSLFSLATSSINDAFVLLYSPDDYFIISMGNEDLNYNLKERNDAEWRSVCASWDSSSGVVELWINGKPYPRKVFQKGYVISKYPSIIIGQEQELYGSYFNINQSFVGEISDIHVWDKALTYQNIFDVLTYNNLTGNVINWRSLKYKAEGDNSVLHCLKRIYHSPTCNRNTV
ncbi:hypothetical protein XENTR_v10022302 [Xenopus tropicalis]|uniref:Pentraxin family member n=1 Tax=Xenopus tropicalis TaxID=8364 RepID=A0A803JAD9_XENTR|nr:C-reactive protein [Xenopus tropicalis]KAE8588043.1 hypothetical protein XENTR_v10022302 [Xenopus tropicalis]|eukprot:XP_002934128.2 PREDICTED: C-reactive protein-like [Xenopus tropicalis]